MISNKWKFDSTQDWEFLAKNFDQVSNELITEADLLRLDVHISAPGYLEERRLRFTEVPEQYKEESNKDDVEKEPTDSEEEVIKKKAQRKKKRDARTTSLVVPRSSCRLPVLGSFALPPGSSAPPSPSSSGVRVLGLPAPSASGVPVPGSSAPPSPSGRLPVPGSSAPPSASGRRMPGSSAPSESGAHVLGSSAPSSPSGCLSVPGSSVLPAASGMHMPGSSAPSASGVPVPGFSTFSSPSGCLPVPGSSALSSALGVRVLELSAPYASGTPVLGSSIPSSPSSRLSLPGLSAPSLSGCLPMPGLSLPFPNWLSLQTPTPIPGKQRLGQWDRIIKRASSEEAPPIFAPLLPLIERPSLPLFSSNGLKEKRLFDKAFNLDSRPLTNNRTREEVDLSFASCQCLPAVKANRPWQWELLDRKSVCMVETIPLAAAFFLDLGNFVPGA